MRGITLSQPDHRRNGSSTVAHTSTDVEEINNGEKESPQHGGSAIVLPWYGTATADRRVP